jgi:hypothetical protein
MNITYCARGRLPRKVVPGLNGAIPLSLLIDGAPAVAYATQPPPRHEEVVDG